MIVVAWTGSESQQRHTMDLPRGRVRALEEHKSLKGRFLIGQFPVLMRFFGAAGEVEQHQYIRMLASGVKSVAGDAYTIAVKAAAVERAISSIGMAAAMVIFNPVPPELHGRPFSEQARALPAEDELLPLPELPRLQARAQRTIPQAQKALVISSDSGVDSTKNEAGVASRMSPTGFGLQAIPDIESTLEVAGLAVC